MAVIAIDDHVGTHAGTLEAGNGALGLWLRMLCWLARFPPQEEQVIPYSVAHREGTSDEVNALVAAGFWTPSVTGYRLQETLEFAGCGHERRMWLIGRQGTSRAGIPDVLREAVYERDNYACVKCSSSDNLTLDHIYPWSLGGLDVYENLQTLCRPCNSRKGAKL